MFLPLGAAAAALQLDVVALSRCVVPVPDKGRILATLQVSLSCRRPVCISQPAVPVTPD